VTWLGRLRLVRQVLSVRRRPANLDGVIYRVRIDGRGGARVARSPLVTYDHPLWRPRVGG